MILFGAFAARNLSKRYVGGYPFGSEKRLDVRAPGRGSSSALSYEDGWLDR